MERRDLLRQLDLSVLSGSAGLLFLAVLGAEALELGLGVAELDLGLVQLLAERPLQARDREGVPRAEEIKGRARLVLGGRDSIRGDFVLAGLGEAVEAPEVVVEERGPVEPRRGRSLGGGGLVRGLLRGVALEGRETLRHVHD